MSGFAGYTPNLVAVVWMGCDDNDVMPGTGGTLPAKIWQNFMNSALASIPPKNFDGSDTSIDNPVNNVESNSQTIDKDAPMPKEKNDSKDNKDKTDKEQIDGKNVEKQSKDKNQSTDENKNEPAITVPKQNLPEPSIQQGKGLN